VRRGRGRSSDRVRGWPRHRGAHQQAAEKACGKELARPLKDRKIVRPNATEACHPIAEDGHCRRIRKGWPCGNHWLRRLSVPGIGACVPSWNTPGEGERPPATLGWPIRRAHLWAKWGATRAMTRPRRIPTLPRPYPAEPSVQPDHGPSHPPAACPEWRMIHLPRVRHRSEVDHEANQPLPQAVLGGSRAHHEAAVIKAERAIPHPIC
jgi:hypothetical protein